MMRFLVPLLFSGLFLSWGCGAEEDPDETENVEIEPSDEGESEEHEHDDLEHRDDETDEEHAEHDTHVPPAEGELYVESEELILDDETTARVAAEQRGLAHILFRYRGAERAEGVTRTKEAAEALAREALERVQGDEGFGAVAADVSDDGANNEHGGVMGLLEQGLLPEPLDDALFAMEVGEVRGPVESALGYHVLTRTE
ncbi:MAG: peptidyl-prolyl cis-trans isomerase D [Polyangiales bacterium]|jgi:peptidyl-prolyl cis-trans isomerase D